MYAIRSYYAINSAGAATWVNGATGKLSDGTTGGIISASNSVIGKTYRDVITSYSIHYTKLYENRAFYVI